MKIKFLFLAISMSLFMASCSSSDEETTPVTPTGELIDVTFNVKDYFTTEVVDMSGTKSTLQEAGIKVVQYRVMDRTSGRPVADKEFRLTNYPITDGSDLVIKEKLPAGSYWIFFIGSTGDMPIPTVNKTDANADEIMRIVNLPNYKTQIFSGSLWLTLGTNQQEVNETVVLRRNVGRVDIVIEDAQKMPAEMKYLYPMVKKFYPNVFRFIEDGANSPLVQQSWGTLYPPHLDQQNMANVSLTPTGFEIGNVPREEVIKAPTYTISLYMLDNTSGAVFNGQDFFAGGFANTLIHLYATADKVTSSPMGNEPGFSFIKDYELIKGAGFVKGGISVTRNKITRLTGKLFEGVATGDNVSMKVTVEDKWDDNITNIPY